MVSLNMSQTLHPLRQFGLLALVATLLLYFGGTAWLSLSPTLAYIAAINLVTLGLYGYDKLVAGGEAGRIPELILHGVALVGGSPAAWAGQQVWRHKTAKSRFQLIFWGIVLIQLTGLAWWLIN